MIRRARNNSTKHTREFASITLNYYFNKDKMTKQTGRKSLKQDASSPPLIVEEERDAKESSMAKKLKLTEVNTRNEECIIPEEFRLLHRYWMASNYLAVGQVSTE